jgi:hypothetical protein
MIALLLFSGRIGRGVSVSPIRGLIESLLGLGCDVVVVVGMPVVMATSTAKVARKGRKTWWFGRCILLS